MPSLKNNPPFSDPNAGPVPYLLRLVRANLSNPFPLIAFMLAILVWGTLAFEHLPRDVFPRIPIPDP